MQGQSRVAATLGMMLSVAIGLTYGLTGDLYFTILVTVGLSVAAVAAERLLRGWTRRE